jgi:CelD/BcsL family acetyltransferase involved in cellulose biosynthesis
VPDLTTASRRLDDPAVAVAWRRLQGAGGVPTPFLSWEWCSALRDVPEVSRDVVVVVVRTEERVVGLLPLERVRDARGLTVVGVAGRTWLGPDHSDVVAAPADRAAVAAAVLARLARDPSWHELDLDGLASGGALAGAVDAVFRAPRFVVRSDAVPVAYVPLDGEIVSNHARKQVRKELRRAEAVGGGFSVVTDPARFPPLLEEMMRLHAERFGDRSRVFATPARRRFHQLAAQRLGAAGCVRVNRLQVGAVDAAITYHLVWGDRVLFYSGGLRTDHGRTPGFSVRVSAMLAAAADGLTEADLLRGDHGYKDRFASVVRDDVRRRVTRVGARVGLHVARSAAARLRARLAPVAPAPEPFVAVPAQARTEAVPENAEVRPEVPTARTR